MAIKIIKACKILNVNISVLFELCKKIGKPINNLDPNSTIEDATLLLLIGMMNNDLNCGSESEIIGNNNQIEYICNECEATIKGANNIAEHYCKFHNSIYGQSINDIKKHPINYVRINETYLMENKKIFSKIVLLLPKKIRQIIIAKKLQRDRLRKELEEREENERKRLEKERLERERKKLEQKQTAENLLNDFLQNNPYIAISDWECLKQQIVEVCPFFQITDDIVTKQNSTFKTQQKEEHKEYFDTLLTYPLDEQQRDAIVTLGENVLVIAAAGSGKTSTIVAKTHYLVNKLKIDPRRILVITYTRKAAEELQTRVGVAGVECTTFHKHSIDTIASIKGEKPTICESSTLNKLFDSLIRRNSTLESAFFLFQTVQKTLLQYDYKYETYKEYLQALREYGKMAPYRDMDNKICYVKSRQEMEIMVILTEFVF